MNADDFRKRGDSFAQRAKDSTAYEGDNAAAFMESARICWDRAKELTEEEE